MGKGGAIRVAEPWRCVYCGTMLSGTLGTKCAGCGVAVANSVPVEKKHG